MIPAPLSSTGRRVLQFSWVCFGLFAGGAILAGQMLVSPLICSTADGALETAVLLSIVGGVLQAAGLIGMMVGVAMGLPPASSSARMPGGLRGRKRAGRQIAGAEPFQDDEVAQLRRFAGFIVSSSRSTPAQGVMAFGAVLGLAGALLAIPRFFSSDDAVFGTLYCVGLVVVLLIVLAQVVYVRRLARRGVTNAEAFLQRTALEADSA
ncbi:hypothetical protein CIW49_21235 [Mycolicibacterium sp. P1-18]|uniref:hypothetical protein n=1 Tax=Mycolicibacterium sp. P1-18 TaxID=2024615 RepID=UPI0011F13C5F|nr:hypothetical protein [Mycolicibacterium sp. P1-18]KAA0096054.1 hypothetical protein CIW49_21235 [Mycolicibacterium sp. P1-18]